MTMKHDFEKLEKCTALGDRRRCKRCGTVQYLSKPTRLGKPVKQYWYEQMRPGSASSECRKAI